MASDRSTTPNNNLPLQLTSFIGREREIAEVKRLLTTTRLLTLTGAGGCGKTRLALIVAEDLRADFPDGVWFVDLAPLSDPTIVPQTIASVFDLHESGETHLTNILQNYLHAKNLLLVLDNCEHLIQACAELCDMLLRACPDLKILATSREALNIAGETSFRVPSLALPDMQPLPPLEILSQYESLRLFMVRANAARSDFQWTDANAHLVARICQRLDGMPLAIELAAARVDSLSIEEIATRLDDRFRLLNSGSRTTLPRNQTLRASIDWSYDLLSDEERVLLRRLAVFAGGFTLEAAESVCTGDFKGEILNVLSQLVQKSLVVAKLDDQPSYRLLETIRQYAHTKWLESGEVEQVRARHLDFFLKFAEEARPKMHSAEQLKSLNRRRSEYENLRVAIEWARENDSRISGNNEIALRLISALEHLADVYVLLGVGTQAVTFYQDAIALCNHLTSVDKMIALRLHRKIVERVYNLASYVDYPRYEALARIGAASLSILKAELQLAEGLAPAPEVVRLLTILSTATWANQASPDWDTAQRYARAAVDMGEKLDAPIVLSMALSALDNVYFARGLLRERVEVASQRLALTRDPRFSDASQRLRILIDTGHALLTVGEYDLAFPYLQEAAVLAEEIQAVNVQMMVLHHTSFCLFRLDRWDQVLEILDQGRDLQKRYPREQAGPECFEIALAASVHTRRGEFGLGAVERAEAHSIMTETSGPLERWPRPLIH